MGLDDFTKESLSTEERKRRNELSQNQPPGDDSKWRHYEPGPPDWLSFITGSKEENQTEDLDGDEVVVVKIDDIKSTSIIATNFQDLNELK